MRIGFVGTGTMGDPIARCLIEAGHVLIVHDRRQEATAGLVALGALRAENPFQAAWTSEVVFTSLPGPPEVEAAVLDLDGGVFAGLGSGTAYIDLTTNTPNLLRRIAALGAERGI